MRIVNIIQRYPPAVGGAETWAMEVCRFLARSGHCVKVLTLAVNKEEEFWREPVATEQKLGMGRLGRDGGVLVRRFRRSLPVHYFHHLFLRKLCHEKLDLYLYGPHSTSMYGHLWREVRKADVVFLHTVPYPHNWAAFFLARLMGKKTLIVPHFHPRHPHYESRSVYWLLRHCDGVVVVSPFEKDYLAARGVASERIFVTGNAIHPEQYAAEDNHEKEWLRIAKAHGLENGVPIVAFIGRKTEEKGVGHLLEAVAGLPEDLDVRLVLCGPGFEWFDECLRRLSPSARRRIIDLGVVSEGVKLALLRSARLLALPSRYEAFGIVFLEAWMCGIPVLGTTEGAMPSVIGDAGVVCRYGDVADLRAKIVRVLQDECDCCDMAARGRKKVLEQYTWSKIGRKVDSAVRNIYGKCKLLICANAYPPNFIGGAELVAHEQAKMLRGLGYEVAVFAGDLKGPWHRRYRLRKTRFEGVDVWRITLHSEDYGADRFSCFHAEVEAAFEEVLNAYAPDVVHFHNVSGLSLGLLHQARRHAVRFWLTLHDYWGLCLFNTLRKRDGRLCTGDRDCTACQPFFSDRRWHEVPARLRMDYIALRLGEVENVISPSRYLADRYEERGLIGSRVHVVPNGIKTARFSGIPRRPPASRLHAGYVGYLGAHKGVDVLIDALEGLEPERFFLHIAGSGEMEQELKDRCRLSGWSRGTRCWGKVPNASIDKFYKAIDVLVLPSVWPENHPVSISEAMAAGIPVVASRIGGIPEMVEDGVTGYLFEPGDAADLAQKLLRLEAHRGDLERMGRAAREKIMRLDLKHQVGRLDELYRSGDSARAEVSFPEAVAIVGKCFGENCARTIEQVKADPAGSLRFLLQDWLDEEETSRCRLAWVADPDTSLADIAKVLRNRLPLVVPSGNKEIAPLCLKWNCGLVYADEIEAAVSMGYLLENPDVATEIGKNSLKLFYGYDS